MRSLFDSLRELRSTKELRTLATRKDSDARAQEKHCGLSALSRDVRHRVTVRDRAVFVSVEEASPRFKPLSLYVLQRVTLYALPGCIDLATELGVLPMEKFWRL